MINSTLCYLERGDAYLMLHRVKKKGDLNHDKWIGGLPLPGPGDLCVR